MMKQVQQQMIITARLRLRLRLLVIVVLCVFAVVVAFDEDQAAAEPVTTTTCTTSSEQQQLFVPILPNGVEAAPGCKHGNFLVMKGDQYVGPSLQTTGEWSEGEVVQIFRHFVTDGSIVVDTGANIGAHTVALAKLAGETGVVHAIEPIAVLHNLVIANAVLNGLSNVRGHHAYGGEVSSSSSHGTPRSLVFNAAALYVERMLPDWLKDQLSWPLNFGSLSWDDGTLNGLIGTSSIDWVQTVAVDDFQLSNCDFIKIDVEGHEVPVLKGMRHTIDTFRPAIYLEDDRGEESSSKITSYLDTLGYSCVPHKMPLYNNHNHKDGDPWDEEVAWVRGHDVMSSHNQLCMHTSMQEKMQEIVQSWGRGHYGAPLAGEEPRKYSGVHYGFPMAGEEPGKYSSS